MCNCHEANEKLFAKKTYCIHRQLVQQSNSVLETCNMNTDAVGTVRSNWKHYPSFPKIAKRETVLKHKDTILALSWKDKRQVFMLSTAHSGSLVKQTRNCSRKPKVIFEYNKNMGL